MNKNNSKNHNDRTKQKNNTNYHKNRKPSKETEISKFILNRLKGYFWILETYILSDLTDRSRPGYQMSDKNK